MRRCIAIFSLAMVSASGWAQSVYKCGSTYSQTPCAADAKEVPIRDNGKTAERWEVTSAEATAKIAASKAASEKRVKELGALGVISAADLEKNQNLCVESIRRALKDPDSAKFGPVSRGDAYTAISSNLTGSYFVGVPYTVSVNAKNSYGGYTGSKVYSCDFTEKENLLYQFWQVTK